MKQLLSALLICLSINIIAQDLSKNLDDFSSLAVATNIKLELIPSSENKMEVDITKGELSHLKIEEKGDHLSIYIKSDNSYGPNRTKAKIKLYFKEIDELSVAAGATVYSESTIGPIAELWIQGIVIYL